MSARVPAAEDGDWWLAHAMLGAFAVMVAATLRLLFGWSAPLHAWVALAVSMLAVLASNAGWRAACDCALRRWRDAGIALSVATLLALTGAALAVAGHVHPAGVERLDVPLDEGTR